MNRHIERQKLLNRLNGLEQLRRDSVTRQKANCIEVERCDREIAKIQALLAAFENDFK